MLLNETELKIIVLKLLQGKGLVIPPCDKKTYDDIVNQVSNYIDNL